jgi:hypothetical protein
VCVPLSFGATLVYALRQSGCVGRLTCGRIERDGPTRIKVYDHYGSMNEYISGRNLQSWCVLGMDGEPLPGWREIEDGDRHKMFGF